MRYLVTLSWKDQSNLAKRHSYTIPQVFLPAEEKELLEYLDYLESEGTWNYKVEVCYTIDRKDIIPPSE